jgi:hypothetical protein
MQTSSWASPGHQWLRTGTAGETLAQTVTGTLEAHPHTKPNVCPTPQLARAWHQLGLIGYCMLLQCMHCMHCNSE